MRERARGLDAELELESEPMGGTRVTLTLELPSAADRARAATDEPAP